MKAVLIILAVVVIIFGLLFTLRSSRNLGSPSADVIARAKERARSQAEKDKDD
jgi:uncharacterized protein YxeA